ncbi:MAG TPA: hypothetical protein VFF67_10250 [Thermoplasmata archaeon]|nr:hypothetical protein [Thermoplasmata archaeon]
MRKRSFWVVVKPRLRTKIVFYARRKRPKPKRARKTRERRG